MDIELYHAEYGEGFPLILLHGNGEDSRYFKNQIPVFSQFYRVITVDTRGHGKSPRGIKSFTLNQFADDLFDFMQEQKIEKAHILGFSDGANIALLFALKHPEKVEKLISNGADLTPWGVKATVQIPIILGWCAMSVAAKLTPRAKPKKEMLEIMVTQPHIKPAELAALNMPVLVIAGTHDLIRENHTRRITAAIPGAQLAFVQGDHFIAAKNSEPFNRAVMEFLEK